MKASKQAAKLRRLSERRMQADAMYRSYLADRPNEDPYRRREGPAPVVKASAVRTVRADGSVDVRPAYSARRLRELAPERPSISEQLRARILRRDGGACRYCGCESGPFEIDHVVPVALGGVTAIRNLVTACQACNRSKGAQVWRPNHLA